MKQRRSCELCGTGATVYCEADAAFLCWTCDARVHSANFLVARHRRRLACAHCRSLEGGLVLAGAGASRPLRSLCRFCAPSSAEDAGDSDHSSSYSATDASCVSTAKSSSECEFEHKGTTLELRRLAAVSAHRRLERVLVNWGRRLGLERRYIDVASNVRRACVAIITGLPSRVGLASALWSAAKRRSGVHACESAALLSGLESCSGVPAKLIVVAELRLARVVRRVDLGSNARFHV